MDEMWFLGADTKQDSISFPSAIFLGGGQHRQHRKLSVLNQFWFIPNDSILWVGKKMSRRTTLVTFNILSSLTVGPQKRRKLIVRSDEITAVLPPSSTQ